MATARQSRIPAPPLTAPPESLVQQVWILDPPPPHERSHVERSDAGMLVDGLLTQVARGRGALDVAIGEVLAALAAGDRTLRLGHSCIGDYARERLGIEETTARNMAKLARDLRDRPLLRAAVRSGEVSTRKAQTVAPLARGVDEAAWVERARTDTVRALEAAVRATVPREPEEDWDRLTVDMTPEERRKVDEAMALAGRILGPGAPKWQRLEAMCQEFLGAHPSDPSAEEAMEHGPFWDPVRKWLEDAKEGLEHEMNRWEFLEVIPPVAAPVYPDRDSDPDRGLDRDRASPADRDPDPAGSDLSRVDPLALDARLRELARMRDRWDVLFGHLAMLMKNVGLWRDAGFASFGHYATERLGMATRTVEQRAALARRCYSLPGLREAMEQGRISYEKARLVARIADHRTVDAWIVRAETLTCIALRREVEASEETQMRARGELDLRVPRRVRTLVVAAIAAARDAENRWIGSGACLAKVAEHFIATWEGAFRKRRTREQKVLERDGGRCQAPGCSRTAVQAHHIVFRSAGGSDDPSNLVALCPAHHLHGVHMGWLRVRGQAPGALTWHLPAPPVNPRQ